jgi:hypothetical protein
VLRAGEVHRVRDVTVRAAGDKPTWSLRGFASTFCVDPRKAPDFAWAFASRFLFLLAYSFLTTYQAYYLLRKIGSGESEVPRQIFLGTLAQSVVIVAASLTGGWHSDRTGPTEDLRDHRLGRVRPGDVPRRDRQ